MLYKYTKVFEIVGIFSKNLFWKLCYGLNKNGDVIWL